MFRLSIITKRSIIFLRFEGRGLQKLFTPDPHFLSHKNQVKLDTAADKRCIEIELHKLILLNTFREGGDTIKDHFPFIHIFQKLPEMMLYRTC